MVQVNLFGPIDAALGASLVEGVLVVEALLLVLVLVNFATRRLAYGRHKRQAEEGADVVARWPVHELTNVVLLIGSFYYMTVAYHGGIVLSVLVVGMFIADFFEFEARKVEARRDVPLEAPKGAMAAAFLVLVYAAYQTLFTFVEPIWTSIV